MEKLLLALLCFGMQRSADGSTIFSYTADSGNLWRSSCFGPPHWLDLCADPTGLYPRYGTLGHLPAGQHKPGEKRQIWDWDSGKYLGEIDEAPYTFNDTCQQFSLWTRHDRDVASFRIHSVPCAATVPKAPDAYKGLSEGPPWLAFHSPC